jgi:plasmid stabilization system protein ParE
MVERKWRVRLGAAAELDFANILKWTTENFGERQSRVYRDTLVQAISELASGPDVAGSKARDEIIRGVALARLAAPGPTLERTALRPTIFGTPEPHAVSALADAARARPLFKRWNGGIRCR